MIVSLGSINADFVVRVDAVPDGPGSRLGRDLLRTSGGKAANVAVLAARLGAPAQLLGCIGDDDLAAQALAGPIAAGVDVGNVRRTAGPTAYSSVVVPPDGRKSIVLVLNANDAWDESAIEVVRSTIEAATAGSVVVVDLEVPPAVALAALRVAHGRGLTTVLDPAPPDRLDDAMLGFADHLTPDHSEAHELTGIDTGSVEGARRAAEQLRRQGPGAVHVKLADGGCALATGERREVLTAPAVDVVDATGAGDAYAGGLAWALHQGMRTADAARVGVAAATVAVTAYGSQESYPGRDELEAMAARVETAPAYA